MEINPVKLNLSEIISQAKKSVEAKQPQLNIQVDVDTTIHLWADEFHFTNVVHNLLDNSIKYSDDNPIIQIRSVSIKNGIQLDFIDNGIGIPEKNLSFIFDKFYRVSDKRMDTVEGFGLGLYYVKKIIQKHKWKISAKNNPEKGIKISIFIPHK